MDICKKLNEVIAELKEMGVYSFSFSPTGVDAQIRIKNLKKLNLKVNVKMRETDNKYPYEVYSIIDGVRFLELATIDELEEHFPHLVEKLKLIDEERSDQIANC